MVMNEFAKLAIEATVIDSKKTLEILEEVRRQSQATENWAIREFLKIMKSRGDML